MSELKQSLQRANYSATDLDQVNYQLLTHLPNSALSVLLKVYNHVWESGCFPPSWREAVVVPVPQTGKDRSEHNFSLVVLTSCLHKTMWGPPSLSRGTNSFLFLYPQPHSGVINQHSFITCLRMILNCTSLILILKYSLSHGPSILAFQM